MFTDVRATSNRPLSSSPSDLGAAATLYWISAGRPYERFTACLREIFTRTQRIATSGGGVPVRCVVSASFGHARTVHARAVGIAGCEVIRLRYARTERGRTRPDRARCSAGGDTARG